MRAPFWAVAMAVVSNVSMAETAERDGGAMSEVTLTSSEGKTPQSPLYPQGRGRIVVSLHLRETDVSKFTGFWVETIDGKRTGWLDRERLAPNRGFIEEIADSELHLIHGDDGDEGPPPAQEALQYSISVPAIAGLRLLISSAVPSRISIRTQYFERKVTRRRFTLYAEPHSNHRAMYYLTEMPAP